MILLRENEVDDHDVAEGEVDDDDVEDDDVKGEEDDDVDVEEEEDDGVEEDDVEEEDWSQDREAHFVRACAVEMHINMSQKPLYTEIYQEKMPLARTATHTLCEPEQSKRITRFHKSHFIQKFTGKYDGAQNRDPNFVRACAVETHVKISQEPLYTEIYRKIWRGPEPRPKLCASLRSRNAGQDFTRATLYGNFKNAAAQSEHHDQAPAFTLTVRTPQCGHTSWRKKG